MDSNNPKRPQRSATDWMNTVVHQLLKFSIRCWKDHNRKVHGETRQEQKAIALQKARDKITDIYQNPPTLAPHFRSIYEIPLAHRLKMPLQVAEQWISMIMHQVKVTQHNFKILLRQHKPIKTHFRTMRRDARNQAKERNEPETPRKAHSRAVQAAVKAMREKLYAKRTDTTRKKKSTRKSKSSRPSKAATFQSTAGTSSRQPDAPETSTRPPLRHHPP